MILRTKSSTMTISLRMKRSDVRTFTNSAVMIAGYMPAIVVSGFIIPVRERLSGTGVGEDHEKRSGI